MKDIVGPERAEEIAGICLGLYKKAADYALPGALSSLIRNLNWANLMAGLF